MSQLVLTLTNGSAHKDLYFDIVETNIAKKWAIEVKKDYTIYENDRFINWPNSKKDKIYYVNELNKQMQIVDDYVPNIIPFFLEEDRANQNSFNILHKFFEDIRGPIVEATPFFNVAPENVKIAINRFNIMIHEFESYISDKHNTHPESSRIIVTFNDRDRFKLEDEDYDHFTMYRNFGGVYINYCEVGKTIQDVLEDDDQIIGNSNIRPLSYYSADFQVKFGSTMKDTSYKSLMEKLKTQYESKREFFENLGLFYDKKLALGLISVAKINRVNSGFMDKSEVEIINSLSEFNIVAKTKIKE
jgi:hypothetical protein